MSFSGQQQPVACFQASVRTSSRFMMNSLPSFAVACTMLRPTACCSCAPPTFCPCMTARNLPMLNPRQQPEARDHRGISGPVYSSESLLCDGNCHRRIDPSISLTSCSSLREMLTMQITWRRKLQCPRHPPRTARHTVEYRYRVYCLSTKIRNIGYGFSLS